MRAEGADGARLTVQLGGADCAGLTVQPVAARGAVGVDVGAIVYCVCDFAEAVCLSHRLHRGYMYCCCKQGERAWV